MTIASAEFRDICGVETRVDDGVPLLTSNLPRVTDLSGTLTVAFRSSPQEWCELRLRCDAQFAPTVPAA
jgi:hypothetical protein